jgi:hypothetical protein
MYIVIMTGFCRNCTETRNSGRRTYINVRVVVGGWMNMNLWWWFTFIKCRWKFSTAFTTWVIISKCQTMNQLNSTFLVLFLSSFFPSFLWWLLLLSRFTKSFLPLCNDYSLDFEGWFLFIDSESQVNTSCLKKDVQLSFLSFCYN